MFYTFYLLNNVIKLSIKLSGEDKNSITVLELWSTCVVGANNAANLILALYQSGSSAAPAKNWVAPSACPT